MGEVGTPGKGGGGGEGKVLFKYEVFRYGILSRIPSLGWTITVKITYIIIHWSHYLNFDWLQARS